MHKNMCIKVSNAQKTVHRAQKIVQLHKVYQMHKNMCKSIFRVASPLGTACRWECNNVPKMGMKSVPPPLLNYVNPSIEGGVNDDISGGFYGHYCNESTRS
jgi:hypothetical protein